MGLRTVLIVGRGPRLLVELERRRLVDDDARGGHVGPSFGEGALECGEVDERLEHRSRLALRGDHAIELRLVVSATADESEDVSGTWIDRDQRCLRPLPLALGEEFVHTGEPVTHRILGDLLHVEVERGVDVDRAGCRLVFVLQLLADVVDEVRRFGVERAGRSCSGSFAARVAVSA